jgi:hypothetical protein
MFSTVTMNVRFEVTLPPSCLFLVLLFDPEDDAIYSSEMLADLYRTVRRNIEDNTL